MNDAAPRRSRFFARNANAFITAAATIIAAIISLFGVQRHERNVADDRVAEVQNQLVATQKELKDANVKLAAVTGTVAPTDTVTPTGTARTETAAVADIYAGSPVTRSEQGFDISLYGCRREGGAVHCYFTVKNTRAEAGLEIAGYPGDQRYSRAYDDHGQLHTSERPEIAGVSDTGVTIPEGVSLRVSLTFRTVPGNVAKFSVLKFVFHHQYNTYDADFPDVTLT